MIRAAIAALTELVVLFMFLAVLIMGIAIAMGTI